MIDIAYQAVGPDSADVPKIDTCASSERTSVSPLKIIDIAQHTRIVRTSEYTNSHYTLVVI